MKISNKRKSSINKTILFPNRLSVEKWAIDNIYNKDKPLTDQQIENILYLCHHGKHKEDVIESIVHIFHFNIDLDNFILGYAH